MSLPPWPPLEAGLARASKKLLNPVTPAARAVWEGVGAATGGPDAARMKRCGPGPPQVRTDRERRTPMQVLCEVSAEELAQVEGGYFLKIDGIEVSSFQWGIGR